MKRSTIVFCGLAALLIAAIGCSDVKGPQERFICPTWPTAAHMKPIQ